MVLPTLLQRSRRNFQLSITENPYATLLSRVRRTNIVVIADRGFPFWPTVETIDILLVDDVPRFSRYRVLCSRTLT